MLLEQYVFSKLNEVHIYNTLGKFYGILINELFDYNSMMNWRQFHFFNLKIGFYKLPIGIWIRFLRVRHNIEDLWTL